ncbi:hypothetical protein Ancab_034790 [Ancistrocladus abbreviatus]
MSPLRESELKPGAEFLESNTVLSSQQENRLIQMGATVRNAFSCFKKLKLIEEKQKLERKVMERMSVEQLNDLMSFYHMMGKISSEVLERKLHGIVGCYEAETCQRQKKEPLESHIFKTDLPGLKKEKVKVEVGEGKVLQISGERSREQEEKNDKGHRVERSSGKFVRRFRLPENVKMDEVKATMENGVLTVTVPKVEKKPEIKSIEISG